MNGELKMSVICLLEEVLRDPDLLPQERKATANILRYSTHKIKCKNTIVLPLKIVFYYEIIMKAPPYYSIMLWSTVFFTVNPLLFHSVLYSFILSCFILLYYSLVVPFLRTSRTMPS